METVKVRVKLIGNFRSLADDTRNHSVVLDLPTEDGGGDTGTTALELAIMSLAGCAVIIFADVARRSKVELSRLEVEAEAEKPPGSPILRGVKLRVKVSGEARRERMEAIWRRVEANCPVFYIFTEQIPVEAELEIGSE